MTVHHISVSSVSRRTETEAEKGPLTALLQEDSIVLMT